MVKKRYALYYATFFHRKFRQWLTGGLFYTRSYWEGICVDVFHSFVIDKFWYKKFQMFRWYGHTGYDTSVAEITTLGSTWFVNSRIYLVYFKLILYIFKSNVTIFQRFLRTPKKSEKTYPRVKKLFFHNDLK